MHRPVLALTQGDPAGIGPEVVLRLLADPGPRPFLPLFLAERAALEGLRGLVPEAPWEALTWFETPPSPAELEALPDDAVAVLDPVGEARQVVPGHPDAADARGALAALDAGIAAAHGGVAAALVTAPLSKATIARHVDPGFRGHTEYLAAACGDLRYGRDHLMCFLAPDLKVALLTTHLPLREAIAAVRRDDVVAALLCLRRHAGDVKVAVAGLNPHAGEGGLLGREDDDEVRPAVEEARRRGVDVHGPFSPDSLFARARGGEFDWVLALYHDQGLIAVKTASFGRTTHLTLGLPFLRTSVDHGTAYEIAGRGTADASPLRAVVAATLDLVARRTEVMG